MDTKIKVITNNEGTDLLGFEVNGKIYKRRNNEDFVALFNRVNKKANKKGLDFESNFRNKNFEKVTAKEYKKVSVASDKLKSKMNKKRNKIIAVAVVTVLALGTIGCTAKKVNIDTSKVYADTKTEQTKDDKQNYTGIQSIDKLLVKLSKTEEGEQIVSQMLEVYKQQETENDKLLNHPDAEGNVLFYKSREILSVQDFSNAENHKMMALDYNDTRVCDYLDAAYVAIPAMYVTGDSNNEYRLIKDKETKEKMKYQEKFAEDVMAGKKSTTEIDNHFNELMETGLTYSAVGVNTAYLGEADNITIVDRAQSEKLAQFVNYVTTNNKGINTLQDACVAKSKAEKLTEEQYDLIAEILTEFDKANIKVEKESRDRFDPSTTEKGKRVSMANGTFQNETITTFRTVTRTTTEKVSKSEAIRQFGEAAAKQAEQEDDNRNIIVDTNNDGKADSTINDANKKGEQKQEELEQEASDFEADHAQGRADGYAGRPKAKNTPAYNRGYENGVYQRQQEELADQQMNQLVNYNLEQEASQSVTMIQNIEGEVTYQSPQKTTSYVRSYNA